MSAIDTDYEITRTSIEGIFKTQEIIEGTGNVDNPFQVKITFNNSNAENWSGNILIALESQDSSARFFLPGYMYGTNRGEFPHQPDLLKQFQRLRKGEISAPFAPFWYMRSDELSHPLALFFSNGRMQGISASPYNVKGKNYTNWYPNAQEQEFNSYNGFYVSMKNTAEVGFTLGYLNSPGAYVNPWKWEEYNQKKKGTVTIPAKSSISVIVYIYDFEAKNEAKLGEVIRNVYHTFHQKPKIDNSIEKATIDISQAISKDAYNPKAKTYGLLSKKPEKRDIDFAEGKDRYVLGNLPNDSYLTNFEGLIGWTNGAVIALPLLQAAKKTDDKNIRNQALEVINDIVQNSINPKNGLPFCTKINGVWSNKGWWTMWVESENKRADHSSYIIGQSLYYILKAYEFEKNQNKKTHSEWLSFVEQVLAKIESTKNEKGAFPRFWNEETGIGNEYDAFSGCWVAAAMSKHIQITGKHDFLETVKHATNNYKKDVFRMECIKTPLDVADAADSEGVLSFIRLTKILHQITGEEKYLDYLKVGLDYELSFKFCYNVPITSAPLDKLNWSASGGSITSVCNAVIHCMSNSIIEEGLYYYQQTGDEYFKSRLQDTYYWGLQSYNREANEFFFGKKGWSTEYFCQAERYVLDIRLSDNSRSSIWFAYHPWATSSILEGILVDRINEIMVE
jgi:hypothetical protein